MWNWHLASQNAKFKQYKDKNIMLDETELEQRLANLEQIVLDLQLKVNNQTATENWLNKLIG